MACSIDHLQKVSPEGFPLRDELIYGCWQSGKAAHSRAPKQLIPNQYVYHGPEIVTIVQEPDTGRYHQIQTTKHYKTWYVCEAPPQASIPSMGTPIASSGKTKQKQ